MIRITIEIDGKEMSAQASQLTGGTNVASTELFVRGASLGATDAGSAPAAIGNVVSAFGDGPAVGDALAAIDAGAAREQPAANQGTGTPKPEPKKK
jgi:hypothetical protein